MDKKSTADKKSWSTTKKASVAFFSGATIVIAMIYFFNPSQLKYTSASPSQEFFQGPAELSAAVQNTCVEEAEKIIKTKNCEGMASLFFAQAENCLQVMVQVESDQKSFEGYFADLSFEIESCYRLENKTPEAIEFLKNLNKTYQWDVYMGPVSCDSKSVIAARLDSYVDKTFKCFKKNQVPELIQEMKSKNFSVLKSLVPVGGIVHQGVLETDVSCPEPLSSMIKTIEKNLSTGFDVSDQQKENASDTDLYLELTKQSQRVMNLHFKIRPDECLEFDGLLAPSNASE